MNPPVHKLKSSFPTGQLARSSSMKARNTPLRKPQKAGWCRAHIIWTCSVHLELSCQSHWVANQHPAGLQLRLQPNHLLLATLRMLNCTASVYISASSFILLTVHNLAWGVLQLQRCRHRLVQCWRVHQQETRPCGIRCRLHCEPPFPHAYTVALVPHIAAAPTLHAAWCC